MNIFGRLERWLRDDEERKPQIECTGAKNMIGPSVNAACAVGGTGGEAMATPKRRAGDKYAAVEALAKIEEAKLLAHKDALFAEVVAEHESDRNGYRVESSVWGRFLTLNVARLTNQDPEDGASLYSFPNGNPGRYYVGSVNLSLCKAVRLVEGRAPDCLGEVLYQNYGTSEDSIHPHHEAYTRHWRPLVTAEHAAESSRSGHDYSLYRYTDRVDPKLKTPNFPRAAIDDQIVFEGVGVTLHCPAGMGKAIYRKILQSTGKRKAA